MQDFLVLTRGSRDQLIDQAAALVNAVGVGNAAGICRTVKIPSRIPYHSRDRVIASPATGELVQHSFVPAAARSWRKAIYNSATKRAGRISASRGCAVDISRRIEDQFTVWAVSVVIASEVVQENFGLGLGAHRQAEGDDRDRKSDKQQI